MVARFTTYEDVAIITCWKNMVFNPSVTENILSVLQFWVNVIDILIGTNGNPHQRSVDAIRRRVGVIKNEVNFFMNILTPLMRTLQRGYCFQDM
ncbi:hypothetical protein MKX01_032803, partial [Papaver californicum]